VRAPQSRRLAPTNLSPVKLDVERAVPAEQWDNQIRALGGCLFHTHVWSQFRSVASAQPLFFRWTDEESGELIGLALGTQRPPPNTHRGRIASYVLIESPPATARDAADFLNPLRRWATTPRQSVVEVQLGSFDARSQWATADPPRPVRRYEFLLPHRDQAAVLAAMRKGTRSSIKRGQRLGVDVRMGRSSDDLAEFARLYESTARRLTRTKGVRPSGQPPEARGAALEVLVRRGAGRLYLAFLDGLPLAGCFFGVWGRSAYYLQNGADDRARDCGAVHIVLHRAITEFMAEGFTRVNLGGVSAEARAESSIDHGLYNFKLGLGTEAFACVGGSLLVRPNRARAVSIARRQQTLLRAVRRGLNRGH
jgi:hypothetical protein